VGGGGGGGGARGGGGPGGGGARGVVEPASGRSGQPSGTSLPAGLSALSI
jgi:hypothetical protein